MLQREGAHQWSPTGVSFSSGGVRIIGEMGALSKLLEAGVFDTVRNWYGCSGGSFCAVMGALGVTPEWIRGTVEYFDTRVIAEVEEDILANFLTSWGVNSGEKFIQFLGCFIDTWEPGSSAWTFADLAQHRSGHNLHIIATNITEGCLTVFNATNTPSVRIIDAMRASSSIPLYFMPWMDGSGNYYCDGAVLENYPWQCVDDKDNTMVITCSDSSIRTTPTCPGQPTTLQEYLQKIVQLSRRHVSTQMPKYWIALNNAKISGVDFHITKEDRFALFEEGEKVAAGWLAFRRKVLAQGTQRTHPLNAPPGSESVSPRDPGQMLETPLYHTPRKEANPTLRCASRQSSRRWSL
jgi:NTE family protein